MTDLTLERRDQQNKTPIVGRLMITPAIDEDYWAYRVKLTDKQAVVGFPKFMTIGVGFAVEEDWNTNLPFTCGTDEIFEHIRDNKGDESISDDDVRAAIALVQQAAREDLAGYAMTDLDDRETLTQNLAAYRLRESQIYSSQRLTAADTMTIRTDLTADPHLTGETLILADPLASGEIVQLSHMLTEPPSGPVPPLPPVPAPKPPAYWRPAHREHPRWPGWLPVAFGATVGTLFGGLLVAGALAWMSGALG